MIDKTVYRGQCGRCGAEFTTDARHRKAKRYCSIKCVVYAHRERKRACRPVERQPQVRFDDRALREALR